MRYPDSSTRCGPGSVVGACLSGDWLYFVVWPFKHIIVGYATSAECLLVTCASVAPPQAKAARREVEQQYGADVMGVRGPQVCFKK